MFCIIIYYTVPARGVILIRNTNSTVRDSNSKEEAGEPHVEKWMADTALTRSQKQINGTTGAGDSNIHYRSNAQ